MNCRVVFLLLLVHCVIWSFLNDTPSVYEKDPCFLLLHLNVKKTSVSYSQFSSLPSASCELNLLFQTSRTDTHHDVKERLRITWLLRFSVNPKICSLVRLSRGTLWDSPKPGYCCSDFSFVIAVVSGCIAWYTKYVVFHCNICTQTSKYLY